MEKNKSKHKKHIFRYILITILISFLVCIAIGTGMVVAIIKSTPEIDVNVINNLKQSSKIYDKNNNYIESLIDPSGERQIVSISKIPLNLQNAFIAIEDERFKTHNGIDVKRIFGAILYDIKTLSKAQGGSTITQQLIKNYALTKDKAWTRKIQEIYLALQLERKLSKDQIMEAYLNTIDLAGNTHGIQAASMYYFGKDVKDLNIAECALISGLAQSPDHYCPYNNLKTPDVYLNRQRTVLKKMLNLGFINKDQYTEAYNYKLQFITKKTTETLKYQWFIESAIDQITLDYSETYNISKQEALTKLRTSGYQIYLTMDQKLQQNAEDAINNNKYPVFINKSLSTYSRNANDPQLPQPQAAAVLLNCTTGEVSAIVGGRGPHPLQSINRAEDTIVARQPGSSIKPLSVYSPSIENRIISPSTIIEDSKLPDDFDPANLGWNPQNYDGIFRGNVTIRFAVEDSINIVAVKVLKMLGINNSIKYLTDKFHMTTIAQKGSANDYGYAPLALGGLTNGVTPLQMAAAYSVFANNGTYSEPYFYTKVVDSKGNIILEKKPKQSRSLSPQASYIMANLLQSVIKEGTAIQAKLGSMPAGGKTGTAENHTNGWFAGITPYYTCVVWMGHDNKTIPIQTKGYTDPSTGKYIGATSYTDLVGGTCVPIWKQIMLEANKGLTPKDFTKPSGIIQAPVCKLSGKAPTQYCGDNTTTELFIEGTEPTEICDVHKPPEVVQPPVITPNVTP